MNGGRLLILLITAGVGFVLLVGGAVTIANGVPIQVTKTIYSGEWGALPALIGLVVLFFTAMVAWDEVDR